MNKIINNRYELIEKIGSGGMADVFRAKDLVLKREVALKSLRGELSSDPISLLRFQREAHAVSGLNHINIVEVYDVGEEEGNHYIVMELVTGKTAKEIIHRRGALEKKEAVDFMEQLCRGILKAHAQGIIHRDLKPQNLMVKADGTVKITDFGIAQAGNALQLTKTDSVMGSVHYLAPECVRGEGASVQSDIYAMGIIFYEMLTGSIPFSGDQPVEIAMKQMRDPIPSVKKYNPSLPNSFVNIISKATHKNKNHRYKSVDEMLVDLQTSLDSSRENEILWVSQEPDDNTTKMIQSLNGVEETASVLNKKSKRKRWIFGGLGVVLIALLVVGLIALMNQSRKELYVLEDLSGKTVQEASAILSIHNIYVSSNYTYEFSDNFESGTVIRTYPDIGTHLDSGSRISVVLSKGPMFEIGDYVGQHINDVRRLLETSTKVTVKIAREPSKDKATGVILKQELIEPGTKINPEQRMEILLTIASEVEVLIPDILGKDVLAVKESLEEQGVVVVLNELSMEGMSESKLDSLSYGVVIRSNPLPGTNYVQLENTRVTLDYYNEAKRPLPPSESEEGTQ